MVECEYAGFKDCKIFAPTLKALIDKSIFIKSLKDWPLLHHRGSLNSPSHATRQVERAWRCRRLRCCLNPNVSNSLLFRFNIFHYTRVKSALIGLLSSGISVKSLSRFNRERPCERQWQCLHTEHKAENVCSSHFRYATRFLNNHNSSNCIHPVLLQTTPNHTQFPDREHPK